MIINEVNQEVQNECVIPSATIRKMVQWGEKEKKEVGKGHWFDRQSKSDLRYGECEADRQQGWQTKLRREMRVSICIWNPFP